MPPRPACPRRARRVSPRWRCRWCRKNAERALLMDANGLRVWQIADAGGFAGQKDARALRWHADTRTLCLDREQSLPAPAEETTFAIAMALKPSPLRDPGGSY